MASGDPSSNPRRPGRLPLSPIASPLHPAGSISQNGLCNDSSFVVPANCLAMLEAMNLIDVSVYQEEPPLLLSDTASSTESTKLKYKSKVKRKT